MIVLKGVRKDTQNWRIKKIAKKHVEVLTGSVCNDAKRGSVTTPAIVYLYIIEYDQGKEILFRC